VTLTGWSDDPERMEQLRSLGRGICSELEAPIESFVPSPLGTPPIEVTNERQPRAHATRRRCLRSRSGPVWATTGEGCAAGGLPPRRGLPATV